VEAVVHGPPVVAGVGVRDAPPARPAHAELQPRGRRGCCLRRDAAGSNEEEEEDAGEDHQRGENAGASGGRRHGSSLH